MEAAFATAETELGQVEALIYNAGKGAWGDTEQVAPADFEEACRFARAPLAS